MLKSYATQQIGFFEKNREKMARHTFKIPIDSWEYQPWNPCHCDMVKYEWVKAANYALLSSRCHFTGEENNGLFE